MNGWQNCPRYKAVSDVPVLACNAAATTCTVPYTFVVPNDHFNQHGANAQACEYGLYCAIIPSLILYADMLHSHDAHTDASQSCRLCCPVLTVSWQPVYLSSAAHLEPVFMYKGEVCMYMVLYR